MNPYSEQAAIDRKKIEDFKAELQAQQRAALDKFLADNLLFDTWNDYAPAKVGTSIPGFSYVATQAMRDEANWKKEIVSQKKAKVREILMALELGANRQELTNMIAALLEEQS